MIFSQNIDGFRNSDTIHKACIIHTAINQLEKFLIFTIFTKTTAIDGDQPRGTGNFFF